MVLTSILVGGITSHYINPSLSYCNSMGAGIIINPYVIALVGDDLKKGAIFGMDSACGLIAGPVFAKKLTERFEFVFGAYNVNYEKFYERKMQPVTMFGVTPVAGFNYRVPITKNITLDNLISLNIITQSIRMDF